MNERLIALVFGIAAAAAIVFGVGLPLLHEIQHLGSLLGSLLGPS